MSGQVFRITELNPQLEMEITVLLESEGMGERYSRDCILFGMFDSDGSLSGITGAKAYKTECLLHFVAVKESDRGEGAGTALVSRALAYASGRGSSVWLLAPPGCETYFERFGFEPATSDRLPARIRDSRELKGIEIASARVMTLALPDNWAEEMK
jgi:N-acetylglutamate synthase-like GNAT family acetyltransferase